MTYAEKLRQEISDRVFERSDSQTSSDTFAIAWGPLIDAAVDIIMDLLNGCLSKFDRDRVATRAKKLGPIQKWMIRSAVRRNPSIPSDRHRMINDVIVETIAESTDEDVYGLVSEFEEENINWTLF